MSDYGGSYGIVERTSDELNDAERQSASELAARGYCVLEGLLTDEQCDDIRARCEAVYQRQSEETGMAALDSIGELDLARAPLAYDDAFMELARAPRVLRLARALVGDFIQLHLQNAIICRPGIKHHQRAWHRDLPYQDFVISRPLAVSALWMINDFTVETGATEVLPGTHKREGFPSQDEVDSLLTAAQSRRGSVLLFDAMLFHRSGLNTSDGIRVGINHVYTSPILKQQIDFPRMLNGRFSDDPELEQLMGYAAPVPTSVIDYRQRRLAKQEQG